MRMFPPHTSPRDSTDTAISATIGLALTMFTAGCPGAMVAYATGSVILGILTVLAIVMLFGFYAVTDLAVDDKGLHFVRQFGPPTFIPWSEITAIEPAPRSEVIVFGWIFPPFPAREPTPTMTSLGHYRISCGKECMYYPPEDPEAFMAAVGRHLRP